jgi:hypothetical protein
VPTIIGSPPLKRTTPNADNEPDALRRRDRFSAQPFSAAHSDVSALR